MVDLIDLEKYFLSAHIFEGCTAVDFTMGNGHDTLFLADAVGESGRVYAFDIQPQAIENSRALLEKENAPKNYTLILSSHDRFEEYVEEGIDAGMFNLGFLPGGDKSITTKRETTEQAVRRAIARLNPGGGIVIAVYPGHTEGRVEGNRLEAILEGYDRRFICVSKFEIVNSPTSPFFFVVEKGENAPPMD